MTLNVKIFLICLAMLFSTTPANGKSLEQLTTTELIKLAARITGAGKASKAREILKEATLRLPKDISDLSTEHSTDDRADQFEIALLRGIILLKEEKFGSAEIQFRRALEIARKFKSNQRINKLEALSFYVKTLFKNEKHTKILSIYRSERGLKAYSLEDSGLFFTLTSSLQITSKNSALDLAMYATRKNTDTNIISQSLNVMYKSGLKKLAFDLAIDISKKTGTSEEKIEKIAAVIYEHGSMNSLISFLETQALVNPKYKGLKHKLASAYISQNKYKSAESILRKLYVSGEDYSYELAELNLNLGNFSEAKFYNQGVKDSKKKIKQRFAIYLEQENYEGISALENEATRYALTEDDNFKYLLGYAHMKTGNLVKAQSVLAKITNPSLISRTIELRKNLKKCESHKWKCLN
jgi:Flp pilus assembly protein TadD